MKSSFIYIGLFLAICVSIYFTYQRSFVTQDFEVINSEEEIEGGEESSEEEVSSDIEAIEETSVEIEDEQL